MTFAMKIDVALISVSNRVGVIDLARELHGMGVRILSTGGTGRALEEAGVPVKRISDYTGFPEILEGRVKTLHPRVHGGILARFDRSEHQKALEEHQIWPIGLVVVNLYPFVKTVEKEGVTLEEAIEQIDIGGPTLIRASAKNSQHVTVVVDPEDYPSILAELKSSGRETTPQTRLQLARKAFRHTASYDTAISSYLEKVSAAEEGLPPAIALNLVQQQSLRYGENPHQRAALYRLQSFPPSGVLGAKQKQGKELSFNNFLDLEAAWSLAVEFDEPCGAIIKHTNPCGAAIGATLAKAYEKALACDPVSAFGSVIGFNREVDAATAETMSSLFVEAVIAPGFASDALEILSRKKNLRVMEIDRSAAPMKISGLELDFKRISGGFLVQELDRFYLREEDLKVVTKRAPEDREIADLLFAWTICKHVKSNAIVLARDGQTIGIGAGQMSRVDSVRLARQKAQLALEGAVMASDAFFPFRDGLDEAAAAGIQAVIQPGGSVRDPEVIQAADEHAIAMAFTGIRHFKH